MNTVTASPVEVTAAKAQGADGLIDVRLTAIRYAARDTNLYEFAQRRRQAAARPTSPAPTSTCICRTAWSGNIR